MGERKEILRNLTCPVCLAYPDKEVFQCHNGHPICSSCNQLLQNCPQCQLPFGIPPIRCLTMESLLDCVPLPCDNEDNGCTQVHSRQELSDHHKICDFRPVTLCKWLGFNCNFAAPTVARLIAHLESCHEAQKWEGFLVKTFYPSKYPTLYLQERAANSKPGTAEKTWFLLYFTVSLQPNGENCFTCVPIHLHDGRCIAQHQVDLEVFNLDADLKAYKWKGLPPNYKEAEQHILRPVFRLTTNLNKRRKRKVMIFGRFLTTVKLLPLIQQE